MKTRRLLLCVFTAMTIVVGCGGTGYEQSSTLTFNMSVLQVDGDFLIHGIVYNDLDGDETFDAGEPGVPDAIVTLVRMSKVMGERTTISDGVFAFGVSEAGAYTVYETDPTGYTSLYEFKGRIDSMIDHLKSSKTRPGFDEVLYSGEPEWREEDNRRKLGILVDDPFWEAIVKTAKELSVDIDGIMKDGYVKA